jgi:hypothetical protein
MTSAEEIAQQYPPQIPAGIYYGQFDRLDSINQAVYQRNVPETTLRPNFDSRSVPTKNIRFSAVQEHRRLPQDAVSYPDTYTSSLVQQHHPQRSTGLRPIDFGSNYDPHNEQVFAPIQSRGPPAYFLASVDTESTLRNQFFALQHGADQATYIPSSTSDLYRTHVPTQSHPEPQPFPSLFRTVPLNTTTNQYIDQSQYIGKDTFNNCTQTQMRGSNARS